MSILVIAEHDQKKLSDSSLRTLTAAKQLGQITLLIAGFNCQTVVEEASKITEVEAILYFDDENFAHPLAESLSQLIVAQAKNFTHILAPANTFGKNFTPRVAALLDVAQISDVISIESPDTFKRPIYAGNAIATVKSLDEKKVLTVRSSAFNAAAISMEGQAEIINEKTEVAEKNIKFLSQTLSKSSRPDLGSARIIVSGGRGLQNGENFKLLESLADKLGAAIGASRAAVDAGYVPNDFQVGQTGKIVAPDLYIAIGISGAIQHLAGMKNSKTIVAINKDQEAPIFKIADYGLVGDLFEIVPQLTADLP